jgi:hypothetical protein
MGMSEFLSIKFQRFDFSSVFVPAKSARPRFLAWTVLHILLAVRKHQYSYLSVEIPQVHYRSGRGISTTSRHISFEFLFIKTCPPDNFDTGFRRGIERRNRIRGVIC